MVMSKRRQPRMVILVMPLSWEKTRPRKQPYLKISLAAFAFNVALGVLWWQLGDDIQSMFSNQPSVTTNTTLCPIVLVNPWPTAGNVTEQDRMEHELLHMYLDARMDLDFFPFRNGTEARFAACSIGGDSSRQFGCQFLPDARWISKTMRISKHHRAKTRTVPLATHSWQKSYKTISKSKAV
eukprot:scaffold8800_cov107-Cylindrotheca_fusiformis.AAC.2